MSQESSSNPSASGAFRRSVFVLVGGTAFGHVISALALPIATRLYSPGDFSVLAVFSSIVFIVSVAACLRFDIALSVSASDEEAANLFILALIFAFVVSLLVGIVAVLLPVVLQARFGLAAIRPYLWWLPLGIFLTAIYGALQGWFVRKSSFGLISRSRVAQSAAASGAQIGLGVAGVAPLGLLIGFMLNTAIGCLVFGYRLVAEEAKLFRRVSRKTLRTAFRVYSQYPKYSTFEALANSAAIQLPVIMIAAMAIGPEAGYMMLAMTIMQAPMALIGNAIGQVYLSRAPDANRNENLGPFTLETLVGLSRVGIGPLLFSGIVAPDGFAVVFGEEWRRAGEIVAWMTPWFILQFLASPLSMVVHVTGHQRLAFVLQIAGLVLRILAVWIASMWCLSWIVELYAVSGMVFYATYFLLILAVVRLPFLATFFQLTRCWRHWIIWAGAGGGVVLLAQLINLKALSL